MENKRPFESQKHTMLHYIQAKGKNRRVQIIMYQNEDEEFSFRISTKRLISFESRHITTTDNFYSLNSFLAIVEMLEMFVHSPEVHKLIHRFKGVEKFDAHGNIYQKQKK